ncbi:pre-toxin TG domain-containing protein [Caballeronia concitans]|nr:pre-toxin TG domain-containing protein [Caballeronia concitans]
MLLDQFVRLVSLVAEVSFAMLLGISACNGQNLPPTNSLSPTAEFVDLGAGRLDQLNQLTRGAIVQFKSFDGSTLQGVFVEKIPGEGDAPDRFMLEGVVQVDPQTGRPSSSVAPSGGADGRSSADSTAGNGQTALTTSNGIGAAASAGISTLSGYLAVPPTLRRELEQRAGALQEAINQRTVALSLYNTTLASEVGGAQAALDVLRGTAARADFTQPSNVNIRYSGIPDFGTAPWALRRSLESSYVSLTKLPVPSVAHAEVRATGIHAISLAQSEIKNGLLNEAWSSARIAEAAAFVLRNAGDLAISLNPMTAIARDATELITGRDLFSGERLTDGEMYMRGISLGVGLVTAGLGSTVGQAVRRIAPTIESAQDVRKLFDVTLEIGSHSRARWSRADKVLKRITGGSDAEIRDLAYDALMKGKAFWDNKHGTLAFFLKEQEAYLQVVLDVEKGKVVTFVERGLNYDLEAAFRSDQGLARRFIPLDEVPLQTSRDASGSIKLFLPGSRSPSGTVHGE